MPKLDTFYNRVFNDNLKDLKSAAENYFTEDNLPNTTGTTTTIKLEDMLDKKLLVDFVDKNNNTCNTTNSYAQVTKTDNDTFVLKVQLSCDNQTDYVLENLSTINSNNSCNNNSNNCSNTSNDSSTHEVTKNNSEDDAEDIIDSKATYDKDGNKIATEYQYKKAITKTSSSYTCPTGYALENNICYKYETGETINATPQYFDDTVSVTNAKTNSTGGYKITTVPNREVDKQSTVCPEGYTLNGNICYKYDSIKVTPGTTTYTCPEGYSQVGNTCTATTSPTYRNNTSAYYTCADGSTPNGTTCTRTTTNTTYTTSCSCPSGYSSYNSNTCYRTSSASYTASGSSYWSNPTAQTSSRQLTTYNNGSSKRILASHTCTSRGCKYVYYTYTLRTSYSCPNGGSLSGRTCYKSTQSYANRTCTQTPHTTTSTSYYSATRHESGSTSYECPSGYSLNGSTCTKTTNAITHTSDTSYSCPTGYMRNGSTCYQYTEPTTNTTYKYTCPEGYDANGSGKDTMCTKTVKSNDTYYCEDAKSILVGKSCYTTTKGALKGYTCPDNYILNNDKCVKKTTTCTKPEEVTNTNTTFEYKWSKETSLDGWTLTGKTRNSNSSQTNNSLNNDYEK